MDSNNIIDFRSEQQQAIAQTVRYFKRKHNMLWNAKMRFGKTLCALEVARRCGYRRTLILTHRPNVREEWFSSLSKLGMDGWLYGCRRQQALPPTMQSAGALSFEAIEAQAQKDSSVHYVYFASMQDLRGSRRVNKQKGIEKNNDIFSAQWDLLIVDEAHEGIYSRLGQEVIAELQKNSSLRTLYLSGTPYNIQRMFDTREVFHWDYTMEQHAKEQWAALHPDTPNPYEGMAQMNIITYDLADRMRSLTKADGLNFAELLRTETAPDNSSRFVHEADVRKFIALIGKDSKDTSMPYANPSMQPSLIHTLWYVPGVMAARCLAEILCEDSSTNPFREYTIVNVAGNGEAGSDRLDIYEQTRFERNALERVKTAVAQHDKTITLSCGRLTMGVSIPEWNAVLMLAGSAETGSMRYFQTIFRCQSPYSDGHVKQKCYAIDFAPKRTLAVVDQYINNNTSSNDADERRQKLTQFLHYCPLVEIKRGKPTLYDTESFIQSINSAYSEMLIRNGFRDDCLYGNLDNLRQQDMKLLDQVAEAMVLGTLAERLHNKETLTKNPRKTPAATKNNTNKAELSTSEKEALTAAREASGRLTPRQRALAILSQISTRLPLMIYGTVESVDGLSLDSFIKSIDPESWREFMPTGITLRMFERLKHFYREDIFVATAKAIVARLHKADAMYVPDRINCIAQILSDFCYPDRETILTPWQTVNRHMADTLGGYCFFDDSYSKMLSEPRFVYNGDATQHTMMNPKVRVLDIASKTGLYSLYVAYSLYKLRSSQSQGLFDTLTDDEAQQLWDDIVSNNIFAVCRTRMADRVTRRTLMGYRDSSRVNICHMADMNSQVILYKRKFIRTVTDPRNFSSNKKMKQLKFDAIIGNPPYQVNIGTQKDNYGIPLYNHFVDTAREMCPDYISMIMPSRWFTGGRGLDSFRQSMLADRHMRSISDFVDSKECFPTVDISGGVNYFLWDRNHDGSCTFTNTLYGSTYTCERRLDQHPIFVRNNRALTLINKVASANVPMLNTMVCGQTPFGFVTTFRGTANPETDADTVLLKSSSNDSYVLRSEVKKNAQLIDLHKVVFSKATCEHAGTPDRNGQFRILSSLAILAPGTVCTQSYLVGGAFADTDEAVNYMAYLKTKFVRFLMLQTITSQDLSPEKFMFVPSQNFTSRSDIDWTQPSADIDRQLYAKYSLTEEETAMIENTIKTF